MKRDIYFLEKTFKLAKNAEGCTSPNPLVGAVIVKNNKEISCGFHKKSGNLHAEIEAINNAKVSLRGATLYVNLEPCCHFGKTPPCVDKIIKSGIKRVVMASLDPNPIVHGKSISKLKKAGIKVSIGYLSEKARRLNEVFFKNMQVKRPFVVVKLAQSLDGKIATANGVSKWITEERARKFARKLRDKYDCVLVGVNTVIKDNPRLNGFKKIPYKVVIDPQLRIPKDSYLLKNNLQKLIILASAKAKKKSLKEAKVFFIKEKKGKLPVKEILSVLYQHGIMSVFVEGGSETAANFFEEKLADKVHFFIAPKILGGKDALTSISGQGLSLRDSPKIRGMTIEKIGQDILITGYPYYGKK
ncbi:MAG: bifunctional diaminohydroxyphosphoribosylaminopyrimidine deaminase/5-amino-6-(5-phosphoribosylamino)uracil reductase RibD [Candidatus Omnitrophica bacterium]|jgi:diaminohydroxyphosphoribosylaminopyrimidine deaminase/5-amino-6-(5-phosphoribosylamino)uracil reductase|nr:bifunctional diaminohydroxyphosphoribosylaminopyrimidine deaminase/5-amino-6-(5-phosphoribosylamino)uracil reductase RibD [Candidatus Omnitrophota bacterium]